MPGILERLFERRTRTGPSSGVLDPSGWLEQAFGGGTTASGKSVTPANAVTLSAVYAAVRLLATSVAQLPLPVLRRGDEGKRTELRGHALWPLLNATPNGWQTAIEWRMMMQGHALLRGNAFSQLVMNQGGTILALVPWHPDRVTLWLTPTDALWYRYQPREGNEQWYPQEEVFHLRALTSDGYLGLAPVALARETLGLAMAAEEHAARFYANDASPGGILKHPGRLSKEALARVRESWRAKYEGSSNAHKVAVLEEGLAWESVGVSAKDAQFLETRQFQIGEVARWFGVPPHMLGELSRSTFSNIEHQALEFVKYSLQPWLTTWEQAIHRDLLGPTERATIYARHNVNALLRGDQAARAAFYTNGRQWGWLSANDVRRLEDEEPIEGGDAYLSPSNMLPAGQAPVPARRAGPTAGPPNSADDPPPPPPDAPDATRGAAGPLTPETLTLALLPVLVDAAGRAVRRECGAYRTALRKGDTLRADGHGEFVTQLLAPIAELCGRLVVGPPPAERGGIPRSAVHAEAALVAAQLAGAWTAPPPADADDGWIEARQRTAPVSLAAAAATQLVTHFTAWAAAAAPLYAAEAPDPLEPAA